LREGYGFYSNILGCYIGTWALLVRVRAVK